MPTDFESVMNGIVSVEDSVDEISGDIESLSSRIEATDNYGNVVVRYQPLVVIRRNEQPIWLAILATNLFWAGFYLFG